MNQKTFNEKWIPILEDNGFKKKTLNRYYDYAEKDVELGLGVKAKVTVEHDRIYFSLKNITEASKPTHEKNLKKLLIQLNRLS